MKTITKIILKSIICMCNVLIHLYTYLLPIALLLNMTIISILYKSNGIEEYIGHLLIPSIICILVYQLVKKLIINQIGGLINDRNTAYDILNEKS